MLSVYSDPDGACPRCGSLDRRDGADYDYEPDGMCWTESVCVRCGLIGDIPWIGWSVDSGPYATAYDPNDPNQQEWSVD